MVRGGSAASVPGDDGQSEVAPPPPESEDVLHEPFELARVCVCVYVYLIEFLDGMPTV